MNKQTTLLQNLTQCKDKKILVIGDIMLDEYHWCKVGRISPEAPVPVCTVERTTLVPGGAANVANNIKALGSDPKLFGVLGVDSSGDKLRAEFKKRDICDKTILKDVGKPTILKSRIVANQQHVVRVDRESSEPISIKKRRELLSLLQDHLKDTTVLLLSDYLKGTLPDPFTQKVIATAKEKQVKVVADPKGSDYRKYRGAFVLTPNFSEFQAAVKKTLNTEKEILKEGLKLIKKLDLQALLVTRSEKGMSVITKDGEKTDIPTVAKEVYDITGAGDTVIAMVSVGLASGLSIVEASYLANHAAGVVVGKVGTSTTSIAEIETVIRNLDQ